MKLLITLLTTLFVSLSVSAEVLLERELSNARNGETYVCRIHSDMQTELINEGQSVGKFPTKLDSSEENVKKWISEIKKMATAKLQPRVFYNYVHRGTKVYSVYNGGKKVPYYKLAAHRQRITKSAAKMGSIEHKVANDKSNVQRLRGQTDVACKDALKKL
jgi:hypothetical protein